VRYLVGAYSVSLRRALRLIGLLHSTFYYRSRGRDETALRMRMRELACARPRFGYRRLHVLLRREGWHVNHKRTYRMYVEEELAVRTKKRKKRASHLRVLPVQPTAPNERWSMDFVMDTLDDGRRFRALTVVDVFTRECLALEASISFPGRKVAHVLEHLAQSHGMAKTITVDNGSEFFSKEMDAWAYRRGVRLDFNRPGKPVENAFIESFNGRLRDECLNGEIFFNVEDAQAKLLKWKTDYNRDRPHSSLGGLSPSEFAANWSSERPRKGQFPKLDSVQSEG